MKKITLLLFTILPLLVFGQNIAPNPTLNGTTDWSDLSPGTTQAFDAVFTRTADGSGSWLINSNSTYNSGIKSSNLSGIVAGDYEISYYVYGNAGEKTKPVIRDNGTGINIQGTTYTIQNSNTWELVQEIFTMSGAGTVNLRALVNSNDPVMDFYVDDFSFTYIPSFTPTYNEFVQNPGFEDQTGGITPWAIASGTATSSVSSDANSGLQAGRIDITADLGVGNAIMGNNYTLTFDTPQTVNATGDYVIITWDMKSSSTALELSWKFTLGGTTSQSLFSGKKQVSVTDTYESFSVTKILDAQSGNTYDDINTLSARVKVANNGDWVIIDNVTTEVVINGIALSTESIDYRDDVSLTLYPNPVRDVLNINSPLAIVKVEVFNLLGQKTISTSSTRINTEDLAKGMYIVKVTQENDVISTKRFIKQ